MEKIAVISDVHGNIPALEAVLSDIRERGIKRIFCLGDLVGKGPHPDKAVDICREVCEVVVQGNYDFALAGDQQFPTADWNRDRLGRERLDYLGNLPGTHDFILGGRKIRLFHASQADVFTRVFLSAGEEAHQAMFTNTDFTGNDFIPDTVGYGHIHGVFYKNRSGRVLFNVGSVGNPLDEPKAPYTILEGESGDNNGGLSVHMIRLAYDIELAIRQAAEADMPQQNEWEDELRYCRYRNA